jgi:phosphoribosylformimino-5-aminoimidazole carboxamide ribotide isomerase
VDARDGFVAVKGWTEATSLRAIDFAKQLAGAGVDCIIYTDIATDGMLGGPNLKAMAEMCDAVGCKIIASGGVSQAGDVRNLRALQKTNLEGVIIGKAFYDGKLKLSEVL